MSHSRPLLDDGYKTCRCKVSCGRWLSKAARDKHYRKLRNIDVEYAQDSDSDGDVMASDRGSGGFNEPIRTGSDDDMNIDNESESSEHSGESQMSEHLGELSDDPSESEPSLDISDHLLLEDDEEAEDLHLSLADIQEQLEAWVEPNIDGDFYEIRNDIITEEDRDNIRAFKLKMLANMPRHAYDQMREAFRHKMTLDSEWVVIHRLALLSGFEPQNVHCCINSCVAYTGQYIHDETCPFCQEARYTTRGRPRREFLYIPLIPRLQALFHNPRMIEQMSYRDNFRPSESVIRDVFDGSWYHQLRSRRVVIDGVERRHKYFDTAQDIALALSADSYLLFKRRRGGPSATPILLQNFNLPPHTRTRLENLICVGVIPGPHQPKDIESFLVPFDDERALLAEGVRTFDASTQGHFDLHAYVIFEDGDIVAVEKLLNIKGHNAVFPCRSCEIQGVRNITGRGKVYYTPLGTPDLDHQPRPSLDPHNLPLRSHQSYLETHGNLQLAATAKEKATIAKQSGIRGPPALRRVASLDYSKSFPYEWMHLLLENVVPTLVNIWSGHFKGLDSGVENYEIPDDIWEDIGVETAAAVRDIPAAFVRVLGNIASDRSTFTAEAWGFWFMHLAPTLLKDRFPDTKFYDHMCKLVGMMKMMLKFELTHDEIDTLEAGLAEWVETYEEYYYQYSEERLSVCTLPIHGLLHVASGIRFCGPVWTSWTFYMERYCGHLQARLHSRRFPWSNISRRVLHMAYLSQVTVKFDLGEDINMVSRDSRRLQDGELRRGEKVFDGYPEYIICAPVSHKYKPSNDNLLGTIATYFHQIIGQRHDQILAHLPTIMPLCGKMRIRNGGDTIRTVFAIRRVESYRDNTFVRYEIKYDDTIKHRVVNVIGYGRLEKILLCNLDEKRTWGNLRNSLHLLAVIAPCDTDGRDASQALVEYRKFRPIIVTDLRNIKATVGRVNTRNRWGIIDRTVNAACASFAEVDEAHDDQDILSDEET